MADIALFMVEESEKLKKTCKLQEQARKKKEEEDEGFKWMPTSPSLSAVQEKMSSLLKEAAVKEMELARRVLEPKSSFALAVFDGFFSA